MLTDAFGSLEDTLARLIVGVVIKQTKLEMQGNYDRFAKEMIERVLPREPAH